MKPETLSLANSPFTQLSKLKEHQQRIDPIIDHLINPPAPDKEPQYRGAKINSDLPLTMNLRNYHGRDEFHFKPELLDMPQFLTLYQFRLRFAIRNLQEQFDNLKD